MLPLQNRKIENMVYRYLENEIFTNAHLRKAGLAEVDNKLNIKYKHKF